MAEDEPVSEAQAEYLAAFAPNLRANPFLTYYSVGEDKTLRGIMYTRGEFYELALRAASVLASNDVGPGDCATHYFMQHLGIYASLASCCSVWHR